MTNLSESNAIKAFCMFDEYCVEWLSAAALLIIEEINNEHSIIYIK